MTRNRIIWLVGILAVALTLNGTLATAQPTGASGALALTITTPIHLPDGEVGVGYSQTLTAPDGSGYGYTWSIDKGSLPSGLTLDAYTGVISGTPSKPGTSKLTVSVSDGFSTATERLSIKISPNHHPPTSPGVT
jgi:hypothetical protein